MVYNSCDQCGIQGKVLQYLSVFGVNLGVISEGMHMGWPSMSLTVLTSGNFTFQITQEEGSWLVSMLPIGSIIGSILGEFTIDIVGRKNMVLISSIPLTLSWLMIAFGPYKYCYFVSRFLAGIVDGFQYTSIPPYTAEISDPKIRGLLGSSISVSLVLGMLFINILYFILHDSIVMIAYIATGISLLTFLVVPFVPESPYFYVKKRNMIAAENSLKRFTGKEDVSSELSRIYQGLFNEDDDDIETGFCLIFYKYKRCLFISIGLICLQHLSGIIALQSYCESLFLGQKFVYPKVANLIYFFTYFLATVNSLFWVDFCGRKPLILFSTCVSCLALFTNAIYLFVITYFKLEHQYSDSVELFSVLIFTSAYSVGLNSIPVLVTSEIFPTRVKPKAHCIANLGFSVISIGVLIMFSWTSEHVGLYVPFFIFGINCLFGIVFIVKLMPETKHKTLEEIQMELNSI